MSIGEERFAGCLIGQCVGDALGFVVEGHDTAPRSNYVERTPRGG